MPNQMRTLQLQTTYYGVFLLIFYAVPISEQALDDQQYFPFYVCMKEVLFKKIYKCITLLLLKSPEDKARLKKEKARL